MTLSAIKLVYPQFSNLQVEEKQWYELKNDKSEDFIKAFGNVEAVYKLLTKTTAACINSGKINLWKPTN